VVPSPQLNRCQMNDTLTPFLLPTFTPVTRAAPLRRPLTCWNPQGPEFLLRFPGISCFINLPRHLSSLFSTPSDLSGQERGQTPMGWISRRRHTILRVQHPLKVPQVAFISLQDLVQSPLSACCISPALHANTTP